MKLLSVETSAKLCGVCIAENDKIIDKIEIENGLTHSETLMPLIQKILGNHSIQISDIDAFICDIGPGSFTGIRIGVATIKAFVDFNKNAICTGVNSLETLAYNIKENGLICSIIDAKNNNCYYALYNFKNGIYNEVLSPIAASIFEMFDSLNQYSNEIIIFVGDGAFTYQNEIKENVKNSNFVKEPLNKINVSNLSLAGFTKISNKNTLDLSPMYLKKPQAQRQLEENMAKSSVTFGPKSK